MIASALTLRSYYNRTFRPTFHDDVSPRTIREYSASITYWEVLAGDVPLHCIDTETIAAFRSMMKRLPGKSSEEISPATINKHLRHLNHLWSKAGPEGPRNKDALGILEKAPWAKSVPTFKSRPRMIPMTTIDKIYNAAPNKQWRALIVSAYNLGSRKEALLGLRCRDVDWLDRTVTLQAKFDKRKTERIKPINRTLYRHLLDVRVEGSELFKIPSNDRAFYAQWHSLQDTAGIEPDEHYKFHDLKRSCGTQLSTVASEWQVRFMLDHAQRDVTGTSYIDPINNLRKVVEAMPQPGAFLLQQQRSFFDA